MTWNPIELKAGLRSDDTPFAAQGSFRDASNIRFRLGRAEVVPGWERFALAEFPGAARNVLPWTDPQGSRLIGVGTHTALLLLRNGRINDITPAGLAPGNEHTRVGPGWGIGAWGVGPYGRAQEGNYFARTWALASWGADFLANPRGGGLYQWSNANPTAPAALVAGAPTVANFMLVTPQRQVLLFGTNQAADGVFNPLCIRVSDLENLNTWVISATNNADEIILEGSGRIIGARLFGSGWIVWTESRCFLGTFVGSPSQSYSIQAVHGAPGLLGPNGAVVNGSSVMWLSPDLKLYNLNVGESVATGVDCPVFDDTLGHLSTSQDDKVTLAYVRQNNELRIDYPDQRDGRENSRYLTLNLSDGSWSKGLQARSAFDTGIVNPIGMQPKPNTAPNVALALSFAGSATNANVTATNSTIAPSMNGLLWSCGSAASHLLVSNQAIQGSAFRYVEIDVERVSARQSGAWRGVLYYSTSAHGEGEGYRSQAEGDLAVGERRKLHFDMSNLSQGGGDWTGNNAITELRFDGDNGPGGSFLVHSIRVFDADIVAPTTSIGMFHERGTNADGAALSWFLETNHFALDEDDTRMLVRGMKPDFKDQQGVVRLTLFFSDEMHDGAPETVVGPFDVGPSTGKLDFFASGKLCRYRLEGSSAPASLRLGKSLVDVVPMGGR